MKIKAAILHEVNTPFSVETLDLDAPREGEVLVKVAATGVCRSDLHLKTGTTQHPLPVVVGHEGAGVVDAVGPGVTRVRPGDPVILNWAPYCGGCFYCQQHQPNLCATYVEPTWAGTMLDGTSRLSLNGRPVYHYCMLACFAEYAVVPEQSCVPLKKEVPLTVGSLIGCAVTTGVGSVLNTARVPAGASVAVWGVGGVGLSTVMGARYAGADRIIAIDRFEQKNYLALELGATDTLIAGPSTVEEIRNLTGGRGADFVFDTTGSPAVQEACLEAARPGGTAVLSGLAPMGSSTNLPGSLITRQEKTITGSYYGSADTARDFPLYADLFLKGELPLDKLISKTYRLEEINEAFDDMERGINARGMVVF
jgi:S-(hydroxymethyl)glutathione dehydrogenase/alcohol dehydrogenase